MNYRHIYHAGNISDVVKHAVLTLMIAALRTKDKPFCVLDSHAGTGLYDLQDERARKTAEADGGIYRLLAAPALPALAEYYDLLTATNPQWDRVKSENFRFYPGSPTLIRHLLRPQDRLVACELHEEDARELRRHFRDDRQIQIHHRDGYEALTAFLPPAEKRGLAFIDPPFENTNEFDTLVDALTKAHRSWAQGTFVIWYPIKDRPAVWRFHEKLTATGIPKLLSADFIYDEETPHDRLQGCGFVILNPPWKLKEELDGLFPALHDAMQTKAHTVKIEWINA